MCWDVTEWKDVRFDVSFQCRTQHDVCWDRTTGVTSVRRLSFNAARSMMCVGTPINSSVKSVRSFNAARSMMCVGTTVADLHLTFAGGFNAARSMMCVGIFLSGSTVLGLSVFQCRTQHDVCWDL